MQLTRVTSIIIRIIAGVGLWKAALSALIQGRHILQLARRQRGGSVVAFVESIKTPSVSSLDSLCDLPTGGAQEGWGRAGGEEEEEEGDVSAINLCPEVGKQMN